MKTNHPQKLAVVMAVAVMTLLAAPVLGQGVSTTNPVPQMSDGARQVLQLAQAKVSDDTIIAFIRSSGKNFGLNAEQIIYLRRAGVSDGVITVMLNERGQWVAGSGPTAATASPPSNKPFAWGAPTPVKGASLLCGRSNAGTSTTNKQAVASQPYYDFGEQVCYYYDPLYPWYPPMPFVFGWGGFWDGCFGRWHGGGWHHHPPDGDGHGHPPGDGGRGHPPSGGGHGGGGHGGGHR